MVADLVDVGCVLLWVYVWWRRWCKLYCFEFLVCLVFFVCGVECVS